MQLGILGFPKSGKTTLFNTLTASHQATDKYATSSQTNMGVAQVRDPRLEALRDLFNPKRYVPATVQYVDIPGITRGERRENTRIFVSRGVGTVYVPVRLNCPPEVAVLTLRPVEV